MTMIGEVRNPRNRKAVERRFAVNAVPPPRGSAQEQQETARVVGYPGGAAGREE